MYSGVFTIGRCPPFENLLFLFFAIWRSHGLYIFELFDILNWQRESGHNKFTRLLIYKNYDVDNHAMCMASDEASVEAEYIRWQLGISNSCLQTASRKILEMKFRSFDDSTSSRVQDKLNTIRLCTRQIE